MGKKKKFRVLVVDDNIEIYNDFKKILNQRQSLLNLCQENILFGQRKKPSESSSSLSFQIAYAASGREALTLVEESKKNKKPFAVAFIDIRMPDWDGIRTIKELWTVDENIQMVICTAFSDYSWEETIEQLGQEQDFLILKKPFDTGAVKQIAAELSRKWLLKNKLLTEALMPGGTRQQLTKTVIESTKIQSDLTSGLKKKEFFLEFQPQFNILTKKIIGFEVLVRWQHPKKGRLYPVKFLEIAEESNFIVELGDWVLKKTIQQNRRLQKLGFQKITFAVNISAKQLLQKNFVKNVQKILKNFELNPKYLDFELTENIIQNVDTIQAVAQLQKLGIKITLDDFGTGNTSLSYLKKLPLDRIKIDKSFIENVEHSFEDQALVRSILYIAKILDLEVIAEGVETLGQLEFLKKHHCPIIQGFYFSEPISGKMLEEILKNKDHEYF